MDESADEGKTMDRSSWIPLALLLAAVGCAEDAVPQMDVQRVSMTSEYRRPETTAPIAPRTADTPILPEIATEPGAAGAAVAVAPVQASPTAEAAPAPGDTPSSSAAPASVADPKTGTGDPSSVIAPRPLKLLVPEKTFQKTKGGELRVSFDDLDLLKVLDAEPVPLDVVDHFPSWLRDLNGQMILLKGWMVPPPRENELPAFIFVRDSKDCCFGPNVKIYDQIGVKMKPGTTADHIQGRPFDVTGRFVIKPIVRDGKLKLLYLIEEASVLDKS